MKPLLKKFILILFIGLISISNFNCECSRKMSFDKGSDHAIFELPISEPSIRSIDAFDEANLVQVAENIIPHDIFGKGISATDVIDDMTNYHLEHGTKMIALMRVSIVYETGNVAHYNIPYVFVSGNSGLNAITEWRKANGYTYLMQAINQQAALNSHPPIYSIVKGIGDYGFWCERQFSQSYSHAERTCILALMYDKQYSLADIIKSIGISRFINTKEVIKGGISKIVIQIKISHRLGAVCNECFRFLAGESYWTESENPNDSSCHYEFTNDASHSSFLIKKWLRDIEDGTISDFIPIEIRVSSNDSANCCTIFRY